MSCCARRALRASRVFYATNMRAVPSSEAVTTVLPPATRHMSRTASLWPVHSRTHAPVRPSHSRSTPSFAALWSGTAASACPSAVEKVRAYTPVQVAGSGHPFDHGDGCIMLERLTNAERLCGDERSA